MATEAQPTPNVPDSKPLMPPTAAPAIVPVPAPSNASDSDASYPARWDPAALSFNMADSLTADPVVTIVVGTPHGVLCFMAEARLQGRMLTLRSMHVQGDAKNAVGAVNLRVLARAVMQRMDLDGLVVEGAVRTSGANPGRWPSVLRFSRLVRPAVTERGDPQND